MSPSFPAAPTAVQQKLDLRFNALNTRLTNLNLSILQHINIRKSCLEVENTSEEWIEHLVPPKFLLQFSALGKDGRAYHDGVGLRTIAAAYANARRKVAGRELMAVTKAIAALDSEIKALYARNPDSHLRMLDNWIEEIKERLEGVSEEITEMKKVVD